MRAQISSVVAILLAYSAAGQSTTTQTLQGNIYASPETINIAQEFNTNGTAGQVYAYDLIVNDAVSNSTIGILQGFSVVIRTRELAQSVYTLTTAQGTLQVMGLVSLTPPSFEAGIPPRVLSITGGTGRYTGASGTYLSTMPSLAPTTSAPASPGLYNPNAGASTNGVIIIVTYPVGL